MTASMSRRADCYDNAPMESFFHTLKTELVHHRNYKTRTEAQRDIFGSDVHVPFAKIWRDGLQRVGATDCKSVDQRVANL